MLRESAVSLDGPKARRREGSNERLSFGGLTLKSVGENVGRVSRCRDRAVESARGVVRIRSRVEGEAPDAASPVATAAAAPSQAAGATHRVLLLEGVVPDGQLLVVASGEAADGVGALHGGDVVDAPAGRAVDDGAASLAGVPLLGEPASAGET